MISANFIRKLKISYNITLIMILYLLKSIHSITSDNFVSPDDLRITKLLASHYDCSKQYNLRQFSLTRVQECNQAPSEIEHSRVLVSVYIKAKAKRIKAFRCVARVQKSRAYCAQGGRKYFHHDRKDWYTNAMTIPKELDPTECKNIIRFLNGTDSPELNQYSYNGFFTYFTDQPISFQAEIERKQNPFTVTKLNTVHRGVFHLSTK